MKADIDSSVRALLGSVDTTGSSFGLAITRSFANLMGGEIAVKDSCHTAGCLMKTRNFSLGGVMKKSKNILGLWAQIIVVIAMLPVNALARSNPAPTTLVVIVDGWYSGLDQDMLTLTEESYLDATNQELDPLLVDRQDGRDFDSRCADAYAYPSDITRLAGRINTHARNHCPTKSDCNLLLVTRSFGSVVTHNTLAKYAYELMEYRRVAVMFIDPYGTAPNVVPGKPNCLDEYGGDKHHFHWASAEWDAKFNAGDFLIGHVYQTSDFPGGARWQSDHCSTKMYDGECHDLGSVDHMDTTLHQDTRTVLTRLIGSLGKDSFSYWYFLLLD